jgi:ABC-2 type transport system permease protein
MRKIWAVALKELRQAVRDPLTLMLLIGLPSLMLLMYGYALNFDVRHVALAVQDRDRSPASRDLIASFGESTYFDIVADLPAGADLDAIAQRRIARAVLVIPEDFSETIASGREAAVQMIVDGSDARTATTLLGYASALVAETNITMIRAALRRAGAPAPPSIDYQPRAWYNPELKSTQFLIPGLIGFILMLTAVLATALSVVREKERGTMEQLRVTALGPGQLILGKTLPYLGITVAGTFLILLVARLLFGVVVRGSTIDLLAVTLLYLMGALGFGLLISSVADSQAIAFQFGIILSMLPSIFLSGFIFPIRSMPVALQWVTYAFPTRYFLAVLRGIVLKGAGLAPYWQDVAFLGIYGLAIFSIAWVRLTRKEG